MPTLRPGLALLLAATLTACGGGGGAAPGTGSGGGGGGGTAGWLPGQGEVLQVNGMVPFEARQADGTVLASSINPWAVDMASYIAHYRIHATSATAAEATFDFTPGPKITVALTDGAHATVTVDGVALTGSGPLTSAQAAKALLLERTKFIPVAVNARAGFIPVEVAVVLVPWQLGLKYAPLNPGLDVSGPFQGGGCSVQAGMSAAATSVARCPGPVLLSLEAPFPVVPGFFPLDDTGGVAGVSTPAATCARVADVIGSESATGTCGSLCRGACGADCEPNNCKRTTRVSCQTDPVTFENTGILEHWADLDCGLHQGCIDHDACYDRCNATYGCGSHQAAFCRHSQLPGSCDFAAWSSYGPDVAGLWWKGFGPFSSRQTFHYVESWELDGVACPYVDTCVPAGTPVTLAGGRQVPIESLRPGDELAVVASHLPLTFPAQVEQVLVHADGPFVLDRLVSASGAELEVTPEHPVWTVERGYLMAADLEPGMHLLEHDQATGEARQVELVAVLRSASMTGVVYNLKTSAASYLAAGLLVHNKCLARGSVVDTPAGPVAVEALRPGDEVLGDAGGRQVAARVVRTWRKATVLEQLPGRRLTPGLLVTVNHPVATPGGFTEAGLLPGPAEAAEGEVFDLETTTGNYYADGVLLGAAAPPP